MKIFSNIFQTLNPLSGFAMQMPAKVFTILLFCLSTPSVLQSQYIVKYNSETEIGKRTINVFPNPNNGLFNYSLEGSINNSNIKISLYDVIGRKISRKIVTPSDNLYQGTFNLSGHPAGLYVFFVDWNFISINTLNAKSILSNSAILSGELHNNKVNITEKGFLIYDDFGFKQLITNKSSSAKDSFSDTVYNLIPNRVYTYKAYAIVKPDTIFGERKVFKTRYEIPSSLYNSSAEFSYQEWSYETLISSWQKLLEDVPKGCKTEFVRVRLYVDLSYDCPTENFLDKNLNIWTSSSEYKGKVPELTYRSSSVRAPLNLDYDFRYIRIGKESLDDTSKPLFVIENCVHGGHESHNYRTALFFIQTLLKNWESEWVQDFFENHTILLFPMINVPGALGYGDKYGVFNYNNANNVNLNSNSGDKEKYPEYWAAIFERLWRTRNIARTHPPTPKPNAKLSNSASEVRSYYKALQPNSEPEARALEGVYKYFFENGFKLGIVLDWHNNGHYRMLLDYYKDRENGLSDNFDEVFSSMLKNVWTKDNYPPEPNSYNESKLYRLLKTPIKITDKFPLVVKLMEDDNTPKDAIPFYDMENTIDYVYINNEKFQIDKSNLTRDSKELVLTKRFGNSHHPAGSKIESSILAFESYKNIWSSGIGSRSTAYWHKRYQNDYRITVEAPSTLRFLYDPPIWRTPRLLTSYYIATTLTFMHLSPYYDNYIDK